MTEKELMSMTSITPPFFLKCYATAAANLYLYCCTYNKEGEGADNKMQT